MHGGWESALEYLPWYAWGEELLLEYLLWYALGGKSALAFLLVCEVVWNHPWHISLIAMGCGIVCLTAYGMWN